MRRRNEARLPQSRPTIRAVRRSTGKGWRADREPCRPRAPPTAPQLGCTCCIIASLSFAGIAPYSASRFLARAHLKHTFSTLCDQIVSAGCDSFWYGFRRECYASISTASFARLSTVEVVARPRYAIGHDQAIPGCPTSMCNLHS